jgi:hypothetical protein
VSTIYQEMLAWRATVFLLLGIMCPQCRSKMGALNPPCAGDFPSPRFRKRKEASDE